MMRLALIRDGHRLIASVHQHKQKKKKQPLQQQHVRLETTRDLLCAGHHHLLADGHRDC